MVFSKCLLLFTAYNSFLLLSVSLTEILSHVMWFTVHGFLVFFSCVWSWKGTIIQEEVSKWKRKKATIVLQYFLMALNRSMSFRSVTKCWKEWSIRSSIALKANKRLSHHIWPRSTFFKCCTKIQILRKIRRFLY